MTRFCGYHGNVLGSPTPDEIDDRRKMWMMRRMKRMKMVDDEEDEEDEDGGNVAIS